jgi:hypothetical protein
MTQKEKDTALLNVCKSHEENLGEVQRLIGLGANVNAVTGAGRTPLMSATAYGHINIVRFLLENGADINIKDTRDGWTALMFSTGFTNEEFEIAKLLIENGADVNEISTKHGGTALMMACKKCHSKIARLLIETPNINLNITSNGGLTALDFANLYCDERITRLFPNEDSESESEDDFELEHVSISKSDIPEEAWNSVAYGDENIEEFLAEDIKNKIFKFNTSYYAVGGEGIKQHYLTGIEKEKNTFYPCFSVGTSIRPRDENVDKNRPLFLLSNLGPFTDFVLMKEFIKALNSDKQYFEIITKDAEDIPTSTSAQMLGQNPNAVGANHCQGGKAAKIFKLVVLDMLEEAGNIGNTENTENSSSSASSSSNTNAEPNTHSNYSLINRSNFGGKMRKRKTRKGKSRKGKSRKGKSRKGKSKKGKNKKRLTKKK